MGGEVPTVTNRLWPCSIAFSPRYIGLEVDNMGFEDELEASRIAQDKKLSLDDAIQYLSARKNGAEAIISFDSDFDNTDLPRKEPSHLI